MFSAEHHIADREAMWIARLLGVLIYFCAHAMGSNAFGIVGEPSAGPEGTCGGSSTDCWEGTPILMGIGFSNLTQNESGHCQLPPVTKAALTKLNAVIGGNLGCVNVGAGGNDGCCYCVNCDAIINCTSEDITNVNRIAGTNFTCTDGAMTCHVGTEWSSCKMNVDRLDETLSSPFPPFSGPFGIVGESSGGAQSWPTEGSCGGSSTDCWEGTPILMGIGFNNLTEGENDHCQLPPDTKAALTRLNTVIGGNLGCVNVGAGGNDGCCYCVNCNAIINCTSEDITNVNRIAGTNFTCTDGAMTCHVGTRWSACYNDVLRLPGWNSSGHASTTAGPTTTWSTTAAPTSASGGLSNDAVIIGGCVGGAIIVAGTIIATAVVRSSKAKSRGTAAFVALNNDLTSTAPTSGFGLSGVPSSPKIYEDD